MAIYGEKDFYYKLRLAANANDRAAMGKLTSGKIAELIAHNRQALTDAMNASGIKVATNAKVKDIAGLLINNLPSNTDLRRSIAAMIAKKEGLRSSRKNADGTNGNDPVDVISEGMRTGILELGDDAKAMISGIAQVADAAAGETDTLKTGMSDRAKGIRNVALLSLAIAGLFYAINKLDKE